MKKILLSVLLLCSVAHAEMKPDGSLTGKDLYEHCEQVRTFYLLTLKVNLTFEVASAMVDKNYSEKLDQHWFMSRLIEAAYSVPPTRSRDIYVSCINFYSLPLGDRLFVIGYLK
jgi:hypothetical protein